MKTAFIQWGFEITLWGAWETMPNMLSGVHRSDEQAVCAELCEAVDEWIRLHEAEGRPLPRSTSLREIEALV